MGFGHVMLGWTESNRFSVSDLITGISFDLRYQFQYPEKGSTFVDVISASLEFLLYSCGVGVLVLSSKVHCEVISK